MPAGTDLSIASEVASAGLGIAQSISGAINLRKDKKELANLARPFSKIQDEYFQNRKIAAEQAMTGTPAATRDYVSSERRQGLGTGIAALLQSGVNPGDVGKLFETYTNSINSDAARDAQDRIKNIDYFIGVNKDLAGQKTQQFVVNDLAPYERKLKQLADKAATDKSNIWGGIGAAIGATSSAGTALTNSDLLESISGMGKAGADAGVTLNNGLSAASPGFNSNTPATGGQFNWYQPNSPIPSMPSTAGRGGLSNEQLQQIMQIIQQAQRPKE